MKVQVELKGFTPLIDKLVDQYGIVTAAVYGAIWRYAQQKDGECWASGDTIADRLNLSRRTIIRHLKVLVSDGYLVDLTPDFQGKSHRYTYTAKASIVGVIEAQEPATESHNTCDRESQLPVTESHTKKQYKKQTKKHGVASAATPPVDHEVDWLFQNRGDQKQVDAISQIETYWRKRISQEKKEAVAIYYNAMLAEYPNTTIPRDKATQGKWGAGVTDHLDNYSLDELKVLYPKAVKHAKDQGWEIYSPLSLTSALSKVKESLAEVSSKEKDYKEDLQWQFFDEIEGAE